LGPAKGGSAKGTCLLWESKAAAKSSTGKVSTPCAISGSTPQRLRRGPLLRPNKNFQIDTLSIHREAAISLCNQQPLRHDKTKDWAPWKVVASGRIPRACLTWESKAAAKSSTGKVSTPCAISGSTPQRCTGEALSGSTPQKRGPRKVRGATAPPVADAAGANTQNGING